RAVAGVVLDALVLRIDRVQRAAIAALDQVAEDDPAYRAGRVGRADDGDRGRFEGGAESVGAGHGVRSTRWIEVEVIPGCRSCFVDLYQISPTTIPAAIKKRPSRRPSKAVSDLRARLARMPDQRSSKLIFRRLVVARAWQLST